MVLLDEEGNQFCLLLTRQGHAELGKIVQDPRQNAQVRPTADALVIVQCNDDWLSSW
jgi:hypothetical protein